MRKFKFRLEAVLHERKRVEDLKLREWSLAQHILFCMIESRNALEQKLKQIIEEAGQLSTISPNQSGQFIAIESFISGTKLRLEWKRQEIERGQRLTDRKKVEYITAHQKRKALEKLKERQLEEHKAQLRKLENKELSDIYIMSASRQMDSSERIEDEETDLW